MDGNSIQKCRTCLNTSRKPLALTERAKGCHGRTYNQLLQEYTKLEEVHFILFTYIRIYFLFFYISVTQIMSVSCLIICVVPAVVS